MVEVVIFAGEDDRHAEVVAALLARGHGLRAAIVDTSTFPAQSRLGAEFTGAGPAFWFVDRHGQRIDLAEVRSFWWRRPQSFRLDPRIGDAQTQHFALQEAMSALWGVLRCCPGLWVNDIEHDQNADYKARQLETMQRLGLNVPDTLITNDPAAARAFYARHGGEVVFKAFNQHGLLWQPTRRMQEADLAYLGLLDCAPVIFQRHVAGVRDIRATVVGGEVFATEFDIEAAGCVDHRLLIDRTRCAPHRLPETVARAVVGFVRALRLEYGCVDLRLTRGGEYVFFEVNTAGEFLYVEERTGQPIAAAVAAHLSGGRAACRPARPALPEPVDA